MRLRARQVWSTTFLMAVFIGVWAGTRSYGQASRLASTPPMGWNDWYQYGCTVSDAIVRANVDVLVSSGMRDAGYKYVNIDDCWQGKRDAQGFIHPNSRFPDMKALADYIHSKGLKFGLYSSPGPKTCAGYEGSYQYERRDAETYAKWGVDFLKYDWCSASRVYAPDQMQAAYRKMHEALESTGRPILFSLCQYGLEGVWRWGASVGGNMWRTTPDIGGNYDRVSLFGFMQNGLETYTGPGHWNDPDILQIGLGRLNHDEELTQMSLWCLLAAPLLAGNNLTKMSNDTLKILTNPEVIAVDQDPEGIEGHRVWQEGPLEVWVKPLSDRSMVVGLFNRSESPLPITVRFKAIRMKDNVRVRDLWARKDLGDFHGHYTAKVPRHGVVLLKLE
ncbi:MAG: glycoside hydrolase family 27 protein [Acidobacteria bacterium]|nr:glycoside hydrolase family 27 protein [Acidobacteriota bacterium]